MQDNSTNDSMEMLIKYMDGELSTAEQQAAEKLLQNDTALQERYQHFLAAKKAIRAQGLKQRVSAIHQEYIAEQEQEKTVVPKVIKSSSFFKTFMSVAAIFILAVAGYGVFQYTSTTSQSIYNEAYIDYRLPVNRSNEKATDIDASYNTGNYEAVINTFNSTQQKSQKEYFLAAQSYLKLNNAVSAIDAFQHVEDLNVKSSRKYFVQETDYYLMLAYIKAGKAAEAGHQLDKILSDKQHLFYSKAKDISRTKLMMLKWKEK